MFGYTLTCNSVTSVTQGFASRLSIRISYILLSMIIFCPNSLNSTLIRTFFAISEIKFLIKRNFCEKRTVKLAKPFRLRDMNLKRNFEKTERRRLLEKKLNKPNVENRQQEPQHQVDNEDVLQILVDDDDLLY